METHTLSFQLQYITLPFKLWILCGSLGAAVQQPPRSTPFLFVTATSGADVACVCDVS